jgi:hypothetical protein
MRSWVRSTAAVGVALSALLSPLDAQAAFTSVL